MIRSSNHYSNVGSLHPGKSVFDLSYEKKYTCDFGQLIPVQCDEVVPGDVWTAGHQAVVRMLPLVSPIMHGVDLIVHSYFVPYRKMWETSEADSWEAFISGGENGTLTPTIPTWNPTNTAIGSLWDYLGFPTGITPSSESLPIDFPRRAYNWIYNEYYRQEQVISKIPLTNEAILNSSWEKDYLTSSQPTQQRGSAPALPISGLTSAVFKAGSQNYLNDMKQSNVAQYGAADGVATFTKAALDFNTVDLSSAATFNVSDLRLAFQTQKWLERNQRAGARYTELLHGHFGESPRDERLQRPEYIGGARTPLIISEVLQTSSTDATTPQGNMAGHGITAANAFTGKYRVKEYGIIMTIAKIMPRTGYQQGMNRQWLRRTKYDFYWPEFAHLSEQAVLTNEIYCTANQADNTSIFGYAGRYDEMRTKTNITCGLMRTTFNYWHLNRVFFF